MRKKKNDGDPAGRRHGNGQHWQAAEARKLQQRKHRPLPGQAAEQSAAETGETPASEKKDDGEIVELSFYMSNGPVIDQERIMEKANAIIEEEINAHLNLILVDGATYADKMESDDQFRRCMGSVLYRKLGRN